MRSRPPRLAGPGRLDLRLVAPAGACWLASGTLVGLPEWLPSAVVTLWLAAAAAFTGALVSGWRHPVPVRRQPMWGAGTVACAAAALAASVVAVQTPSRLPPVVRASIDSRVDVGVVVTVLSMPVEAQSFVGASAQVRFTGTITELRIGQRAHRVSVPALVYAAGPPAATTMRIGSGVYLHGTLRASEPGEAVAVHLFGRGPPEPVGEPPWWLAWAGELRERFSRAASNLPGDGGKLLPGLAIGDTSAVSDNLDAAMKASSLSHLTAVSGANCVIVVASVLLLGGAVGLRRWARIAASLTALVGFVVLVTPEPSVLRAAVMATIVMIALATGRPGSGLPSLLMAVILLLVADPWLSRSYGFTLSVLATAGLLVLSGPLARALGRWMPRALAVALAVPIAAQLACQPVLVLLSPTLPLYGVPANLLAAPAAPVATIAGLIACLLLPWLPGIADAVLAVAWVPSAWIAAVATAIATFPNSRLPWWGGAGGALLIAVLTALALALVLRFGRIESARWAAAGVALLLFVGTYAGSLIGTGVGRAMTFPADWQIAACDIGQGDAIVVRDGENVALIDVGPNPALLTQCLSVLGIDEIDLLVLTHYDLDHVGGLDAVLGMVEVALVGASDNPDDESVQRRLAVQGAEIRPAVAGDHGVLGGLTWRILWPVPVPDGPVGMQTGNAGSVTVEFAGRGIRSVFLGDLGEESQRLLRAASKAAAVDVVKVAHHGSGDQDPGLYERLGASVGLITVGADNGYGHPTARLLDLLRSAGTTPFRTDRQGMLVVAPGADAGGVTVWTERTG
jgi:competence protein ComEC